MHYLQIEGQGSGKKKKNIYDPSAELMKKDKGRGVHKPQLSTAKSQKKFYIRT